MRRRTIHYGVNFAPRTQSQEAFFSTPKAFHSEIHFDCYRVSQSCSPSRVFPVPVEVELTWNQSPLILYRLNWARSHAFLLWKSLCDDALAFQRIRCDSLPIRISRGAILSGTVRAKYIRGHKPNANPLFSLVHSISNTRRTLFGQEAWAVDWHLPFLFIYK